MQSGLKLNVKHPDVKSVINVFKKIKYFLLSLFFLFFNRLNNALI